MISYLVCGMIEDLVEKRRDVELGLKEVGYEVGIKLLEMYQFERELHVPTLLYRLTFNLLSNVSNTDKKIEKAEDSEDTYLLTDSDGMFSRFVSNPQEWDGFCADSVVCGIIQASLMASGHLSEVTAFTKPTDSHPHRVVFQIIVLKPDE